MGGLGLRPQGLGGFQEVKVLMTAGGNICVQHGDPPAECIQVCEGSWDLV